MFAVSADDIKKIGQIREKLFGCSTEEAVNGVFNKFGITDYQVKTMLLRQSMQVQELYDADEEPLTDEDAYEEELDFFLDGKWRDLI